MMWLAGVVVMPPCIAVHQRGAPPKKTLAALCDE